jgi:protocatechuate 3,4-dioxygenase beta subunit
MTDDRAASRRVFLRGFIALPMAGLGAGIRPAAAGAAVGPGLELTPECADADDLTPRAIEGPYFKHDSPERVSLAAAGVAGKRIAISGQVRAASCQPVGRALLDFWQADGEGEYDLEGYGFRGHQFTDAAGRYTLETIVPGRYAGRTRHIHVKVQAPSGPVLTTQLYFPGEASNRADRLYRPELEVRVADGGASPARFDFVIRT